MPRFRRLQKQHAGSGAHGDIHAHIIDLARFLVGEFDEACGQLHTFIKQRPLPENPKRWARDRGRCCPMHGDQNGALANPGHPSLAKNHIHLEINGSKGRWNLTSRT